MQTKRDIEAVLAGLGRRTRKRFGQHFLIDGNLMRRLVDRAEIGPADGMLEVGAGTGGLTDLLVERAARVVAVEVDRDLCGYLAERFADANNFTLIEGDVLARKSALSPAVVEAVRKMKRELAGGRLLLVANLPYSIASPLLVDLLLSGLGFDRLCFTVQKEVGQRILAKPGTKEYGPLTVILQAVCRCEKIAAVPRQAFWPVPEVDSVMLRLDPAVAGSSLRFDMDVEAAETIGSLKTFADVVRAVFGMRRKTLGHVLRAVYGADVANAVADRTRLDPSRRSETLSVAEWVELATVIGYTGAKRQAETS